MKGEPMRSIKTILGVIVLSVLTVASSVQATVSMGPSISVNFGANEGGGSLVGTDVAGVVPTANWNNASGNTGTISGLNQDLAGVASATGVNVTWNSNNT